MFDEYVEGDEGSSKVLPVQGFEDGAVYAHRDEHAGDEVEDDEPIFSIGRVQFSPPSPVHALECKNNRLVIACHGLPKPANASTGGRSPQLMSIDLDKPSQIESIDLPVPFPSLSTRTSSLRGLFVDPTGRHAIVGTHSGDNYYIFLGQLPPGTTAAQARRPRHMSKFKGAVIESVAWNAAASTNSYSTREILLGTALGQLLETNLTDPQLGESSSFSIPGRAGTPERYFKHALSLPERVPVTGLHFETWSKKVAVLVTTQSRLYQFVGQAPHQRRDDESPFFEPALAQYASGDVQPKMLDLPGDGTASELHVFSQAQPPSKSRASGLALPQQVAWLAGPGIYHGKLSFPSSSDALHPGDGIIESASLVPFPSGPVSPTHLSSSFSSSKLPTSSQQTTETPKSMALTEWHTIVLYEDKVKAVSLLSDKVVFESDLNLPVGEDAVRVMIDPVRKTCWMHTSQSIFEITIREEDRHVWRVYLGRSNFDLARKYAKSEWQRNDVMTAEADAHFAGGRFIQAAQSYAQSSARFEDIALRFIDRDERDALRYYLVARLERLKKTDVIQRLMLATWLVEIFLGKMNQLEDLAASERVSEDADNFVVEKSILEDDMRQFLSTYKDVLDHKTVFELIDAHGRDDLMMYFAQVVRDYERMCEHLLLQDDWPRLLEAVVKSDDVELFVRHATVLVKHCPGRFVDALMRRNDVDVRRLLPSFTRHIETSSTKDIVRYLMFAITDQFCDDTAVFHTLLTLLAGSPSIPESELVTFLSTCPDSIDTGEPFYDLDYALRVCRSNKRLQACVMIYSKMGMYEASVDLALQNEDVELAKMSADKPEDDEVLRKNLWLKVAEYVVRQKQDIKTAVKFLSSTDLLKIEDILPFFPDFVVIDDFKEEICNALESYSAHIEQLKADMDEAARSAEAIKSDIADLKQRFVVVEADDKCSSCHRPLISRQFYVFPCQHSLHADCLIREVTEILAPSQLKRMLDLQAKLSPQAAIVNGGRHGKRRGGSADDGGLLTSRKIAAASVQGLDSLRKLVLPDALLDVVSSALPGTLTGVRMNGANGTEMAGDAPHKMSEEDKEVEELHRQLDEMIASSCVLCEGAIQNLDRPFTSEGETM